MHYQSQISGGRFEFLRSSSHSPCCEEIVLHFVTHVAGGHARSGLKKWKVFVGVNSGNSGQWNEEVEVGYLSTDYLP